MAKLYIDIEGSVSSIVELGVVIANNTKILNGCGMNGLEGVW